MSDKPRRGRPPIADPRTEEIRTHVTKGTREKVERRRAQMGRALGRDVPASDAVRRMLELAPDVTS